MALTVESSIESEVVAEPPRCLVILVNWRRPVDTIVCIESLLRLDVGRLTIAVCENGSGDGSFAKLADYLEGIGSCSSPIGREQAKGISYTCPSPVGDRTVFLLDSGENLGFAGGNNLAYRLLASQVMPEYVWFLNNDTVVRDDALSPMLKEFERNSNLGICGSTLVYEEDRVTVQALGGAVYNRWTGLLREVGNGIRISDELIADLERNRPRLDYISGASMLVSSQFLVDVGLMDESYFLYFEELDWAFRAKRSGYEIGYAPRSVIFHKEGAVLGSGAATSRSALAEYYGIRNRLRFTRRYVPIALPIVWLFGGLQVIKRLLAGNRRNANVIARVLFGLSYGVGQR